MKTNLTIKAIIRWEQLRGRSFTTMDYSDKEDVAILLYVTTLCSAHEKIYTLEVFRQTLANKKVSRDIILDLEREAEVLRQFQNNSAEKASCDIGNDPATIGSIVSTLTMSGLDAHYALNEMELCDLPLYIEAHEQKKKEQMEASRLWTFFSILPHIDSKKISFPQDLYRFPWEIEEAQEEAERAISEDVDSFEEFMKKGMNFIKA